MVKFRARKEQVMAAKNEAKIKFSADTSEFNSKIEAANSSLKGLKSELKLNAAQMANTDDATNVLSQQHNLLQQELDASKQKTEALEGKLKSATAIFGEGSNEVAKLKNDVNYAKAAEEKLTSEIGKCEAKLKQQTDTVAQSKSALGQLTSTIKNQEQELNTLKQKYANVILEQGQESTEAKQLKSNISQLSTELQDNVSKLNKVKTATQEMGGQMQESGNMAKNSSDGYTILKGVVANLATKAISVATEEFKQLAVEGERALNKLSSASGVSGKDLKQYDGVMKELYKSNYADSMEEASASMNTVIQQMGKLKAPEVQNITSKALLLSKTFDMDVNESVRAAKSLMKQFGIDSDTAFALISEGAQNGLNQNGDLLDVINEYSVQFKNSGYTAIDMFNMLDNGTKQGTWSVDKLGDAVKEFQIRMSDGSANEFLEKLGLNAGEVVSRFNAGGESAKGATKDVMKALSEVKNENERYKIGVGLMGTQYEDLGEDAVQALMNTDGQMKVTKKTMDDIDQNSFKDVGSNVTKVGRTLKTELAEPIVKSVKPAVEGLTSWMLNNMPIVKPIVIGLAAAFTALAVALAITGLISAVQKAMMLLNGTLMANPIVFIIAAVIGLVTAFVYLWNHCEAFRNFFVQVWESMKSVVMGVVNFYISAYQFAWGIIKGIWEGVTGFYAGIWEGIKSVFRAVGSFFIGLFCGAWEGIKGIWNGAGQFFSGVWSGIKGAFGAVADWFSNVFQNAWQGVKNVFSAGGKIFEGIKENIAGVFFTVVNGIVGGLNTIIGAPFKMINKAFDKIKGVSILGAKPFAWLPTLDVPQIPKFAKGGIVNGATLNIAGEAGPEAIVPIDKLRGFIESSLLGILGQGSLINYDMLYNIFKKAMSEQSQSIILDEREIGRVGREIYGW